MKMYPERASKAGSPISMSTTTKAIAVTFTISTQVPTTAASFAENKGYFKNPR